ncbi:MULTISPECIES: PblA [Streptococcus]|uniref:PblA n=1 Tax=Streptococcus TaxID=1301 RepID=UPI0029C3AC32|nr:PblA [Streptococcus anginosus]MDX5003912.1 PblA [Streptococcus anginosus]MDX5025440.1 PblA [Streptococcus anginosus]MDX5034467.1 PblA [Streptococcus anginosus]MDX5101566.1 PblA [Streptococcus anginosus]
MATELGQAYVQIMPSAKGISGSIQSALAPEATAAGNSAGSSIGSSLVKAATGIIAAAGIGKAFSAAINEGAALQQSLGGIETLFKGSADKVKAYANEAYRTTGLSANTYMENVTGFSASLLQSLGGDTNKAAEIANMAMVDMSDNANKMGTSMDRIQDAYQGFAKQNYTMLDNLKLGYGGTKTEMERLLADATKLTGVKYDINNLSDVYQAIHAIQGKLDITGTTAKEAATTFSGSFASMKAAAQNVLGKLALGEDIMPSLKALAETTSTFLFKNFIPMVGNILRGLPTVIGTVLKEGIAAIFGDGIAKSITDKIYDIYTNVSGVLNALSDMIFGSGDKADNKDFLKSYLGIDEKTASSIVNIGENIRVTFENIGSTIGNIAGIVSNFVSDLLGIAGSKKGVNAIGSAFESVTGFIKSASGAIKNFTTWLKSNETAMAVLKSTMAGLLAGFLAFKTVATIISGFTAAISTAKGAVLAFNAAIVANPIGAIAAAIAAVVAGLVWFFTQTKIGQKIWSGFVSWIKQAWQGIADFFVGIWSGISDGAKNLWNGVTDTWNAVVDTIKNAWNGIVEFFSNLWSGITSGVSAAWTAITQVIMTIVQPFIDGFINIWNGIKDGLSQMWEGVKMIFQGAWDFIKSIVLGAVLIVLDIVTGNFGKLGEDLGLIWQGISDAVSMVWEGIKTYFMGVVSAIVGYGQSVFENFSNILSAIWDFIKNAASAAWEWIKTTISNLITGLVQGAQNIWNGFMNFLSNLWNSISSTAVSAWNGLKSSVQAIINGIVQGAQNAWNSMKQGVSNLVSGIANIFNGLRNINLWSAGRAILDGFLGGLKSAWQGVTDFVGGIAGWIRDHKGPIEYDRKLLIPAGRAIMNGLNDGLRNQFKSVKSTVSGMAGEIADSLEAQPLSISLSGLESVNPQMDVSNAILTTKMANVAQTQSREIELLSIIAKLANRPTIVSQELDKREISRIIAEPVAEEQARKRAILNAVDGLGWRMN